jgi:hypothetical protein
MLKLISLAALKGLLLVAVEVLATALVILAIHYACKLIARLLRKDESEERSDSAFRSTKLDTGNTVRASSSRPTVVEVEKSDAVMAAADEVCPPKEPGNSTVELVSAKSDQ